MQLSTIIFIFCIIFFRKILVANPLLLVFTVTSLGRIFLPLEIFYINNELNFEAVLIAGISIVFVFIFACFTNSVVVNNENTIAPIKWHIIWYTLFLIIFCVFIICFIHDINVPLFTAIEGDYVYAHNNRVFLTKETKSGVFLELILKLLLPCLNAYVAFNSKKRNELLSRSLFIIISTITAGLLFQKAVPIQNLIVYFLFSNINKPIAAKKLFLFILSIFAILWSLSYLYNDGSGGILKLQDLIFRRMGTTPALVFEAYIDYYNKYGMQYLEHNYIINKTHDNKALPMLIYDFLNYGTSDVGWANGYFAGDAYVNFGLVGVIFVSSTIGCFIGLAYKHISLRSNNIFKILTLLLSMLIVMSLPGNSFFSISLNGYFALMLITLSLSKYKFVL